MTIMLGTAQALDIVTWEKLIIYLLGILTALLLPPILKIISKRAPWQRKSDADADIYGLEHALLNLKLPPESMWMNMGYWKDTEDFPTACKNLLLYLLEESGILKEKGVNILDLGFGCGEQTMVVGEELAKKGVELGSYVGLTLNEKQVRFACERLAKIAATRVPAISAEGRGMGENMKKIRLFQADAADPGSWTEAVNTAVKNENTFSYTAWTIALDSLYHFQPSREKIFYYLSQNLHSSLVAFDFLIPPQPLPFLHNIMLHIICLLGQIPRSNLLTPSEYKAQLIVAGYREADVRIIDISPHVFPGLERFIKEHGKKVREAGVTGGWGKFSAVGKMVGWWARTGVVRGCVIIARKN